MVRWSIGLRVYGGEIWSVVYGVWVIGWRGGV